MTSERLSQLRQALAVFLETPLVTMEAYALPPETHVGGGRLLDAASPLAVELRNLLLKAPANAARSSANLGKSTETLYRIVVPKVVAAQLGAGLVRHMPSKAVKGGIHSAILGRAGIVRHTTFVPVASPAGAGAAATAGGAAGAATAAGVATMAGPLVLLAMATAASVYAEEQRRKAMERLTELLEELATYQLNEERDRLNGATRAIEKATALLLDKGEVGHSLGLDAAVNTVETALSTAERRVGKWRRRLEAFPTEGVDIRSLIEAFAGIDQPSGAFRVKLRLASLAIAMQRRVAVLQAVEHAQKSPELDFRRFTAVLQDEQERVDNLQSDLRALLVDIAELQLRAPNRHISLLLTRSDANDLLAWPGRLRQLMGEESAAVSELPEIEIGLIQRADGKVLVLPAAALPQASSA